MNKPSVAISTWLEQFICRAVQRGCDEGVAATYGLAVFCNSYTK